MDRIDPSGADVSRRQGTLDQFLTPGRFAILFGLLLFATFPKVLLGFETFSYIDSGLFAYPVAFYHHQSFWRGELPFWNPLSECGIPFLAQWNTMTLYPGTLLYLLLPMPWSFGVFCLAHLFGAGLGMYYLARSWTGSCMAATVAGTAYGFNGLFWYGLMWPNMIAAACWAPWLLLLHTKAWREGGRWTLAAGAMGALQMLTGGVEFILQSWLILGGVCLLEVIYGQRSWQKVIINASMAAVISVGLAAVQLLPFLDLLRHSERASGIGDSSVAAMSVTGWANFLVPLFHYCRNVQGVLVPTKLSWTGSWYLGIAVFSLAALAVWKVRDRRKVLLLAGAISGLVLALGKSGLVYDMLKGIVPIIGMIRFPVKFVFLAVFAFPLLAAFGLQALENNRRVQSSKFAKDALILWIAIAALTLAISAIGWMAPKPNHDVPAMLLSSAVRLVFLFGIGAVLLVSWRGTRSAVWGSVALPVLLWADVLTHGSNLSPAVAAPIMHENAIREHFGWTNELRAGESRAMLGRASMHSMLVGGATDPEIDTQGRRLSLFMNYNLLDGVPKVDGLYSLELAGYGVVRTLWLGTNEAPGLRNFLGVSHLNNPADVTQWLRLTTALPLVTTGQRPVFEREAQQIAGLVSSRFDPAELVYLPLEEKDSTPDTGRGAHVTRTRFSAHRIDVEVESSGDAIVVFAQAFYHCWKATVNGKSVPLLRANHAFQAVRVGTGRNSVVLSYRDDAFRLGLGISMVTLLGCCATWFFCPSRIPKSANRDPGPIQPAQAD